MPWQQWTATEATGRDTSTQKVERHMGDSSVGPTLRTEKIIPHSAIIPIWLHQMTNTRVLYSKWDQPQWAALRAGSLDGTASALVLHQLPLEQIHYKGKQQMLQHTLEIYFTRFLQIAKYKPWQQLKNGSASRLKHGDDCGPISGERVTWGSWKDEWLKSVL